MKRLIAAAVLGLAAAIVVPAHGWAQSPAPAVPGFIGPTPVPGGTPCPGELEAERHISGPQAVSVPPESASFFAAHNQRNYALFVLAVRLDGKVAIELPLGQDLDPALRAALVAYAQSLTIVPAIAGCSRPGAIVVGHVAIPAGTVTFTMQMVPPSPAPGSPHPLPSI